MAPKPNTSLKRTGHKIYPYRLASLEITRVHQVWSTDITYVRLNHGFVYLVAVIDLYSRQVLSWEVSVTMGCSRDIMYKLTGRTILTYFPPK